MSNVTVSRPMPVISGKNADLRKYVHASQMPQGGNPNALSSRKLVELGFSVAEPSKLIRDAPDFQSITEQIDIYNEREKYPIEIGAISLTKVNTYDAVGTRKAEQDEAVKVETIVSVPAANSSDAPKNVKLQIIFRTINSADDFLSKFQNGDKGELSLFHSSDLKAIWARPE